MMKRNEILMKMEMANESLLTEATDGVHEMFEKDHWIKSTHATGYAPCL